MPVVASRARCFALTWVHAVCVAVNSITQTCRLLVLIIDTEQQVVAQFPQAHQPIGELFERFVELTSDMLDQYSRPRFATHFCASADVGEELLAFLAGG